MKPYAYLLCPLLFLSGGCSEKQPFAESVPESQTGNIQTVSSGQTSTQRIVAIGSDLEFVKSEFGKPERIGKTAFGDTQWTYPNPNASEGLDESLNKTWIVFDEKSKVKEIHNLKVCWLSES